MRIAVLAVLIIGCAHDVRTAFPTVEADAPTATLELRFTRSVKNLSISVNGALVVADADTANVVIEGVPAGRATVMLACDGAPEKVFEVDLEEGKRIVVPLAGAEGAGGVGNALVQSAITAGIYLVYFAVRSAI